MRSFLSEFPTKGWTSAGLYAEADRDLNVYAVFQKSDDDTLNF